MRGCSTFLRLYWRGGVKRWCGRISFSWCVTCQKGRGVFATKNRAELPKSSIAPHLFVQGNLLLLGSNCLRRTYTCASTAIDTLAGVDYIDIA